VWPPGAASPSAKSMQEVEIPLAAIAGRMKRFSENTSTTLEVMDSNTLNFKPNFKFSRLIFLRGEGDARTLPVCASKPWLISSACKISGRTTP